MIKVERSRVPVPAVYNAPEMLNEQAKLEEFFRLPPANRAQQEYAFKHRLYRLPDIALTLWQLFSGKCAYCESLLTEPHMDQFRPKRLAVNLDGKTEPDCYGWLAYEWTNA